jgi:hypothetical protein
MPQQGMPMEQAPIPQEQMPMDMGGMPEQPMELNPEELALLQGV